MFGCGMCSACKDAYPAASVRRNVSVRVYAFELLKPNHWLLSRLFEKHRVPGQAYHAAVSNYSGTAYAPTGVRTGQEWTSAEMGEQQNPQQLQDVESVGSAMSGGGSGRRARSKSNAKSWAAVQSITVDSFARSEGLSHIHWLSIDAEGWDALILEGASSLLSVRGVDLLEFECTHAAWGSNARIPCSFLATCPLP